MNNLAAKTGKKPPSSPYLSERISHNSKEKAQKAELNYWRIGALLCLLIALAAVGGVIHIGQQSKFIPYVVEVDKLGQHATAQIIQPSTPVDVRVIKTAVINFIEEFRLVTPDIALQNRAVHYVYNHVQSNQPASAKANEFYQSEEMNPFSRAAKLMVSTKIESVLQQTSETWQVDWIETVRDRQGIPQGQPIRMRAMVSVYVSDPAETGESPEQIQSNPLGIYVRDFTWSQQL